MRIKQTIGVRDGGRRGYLFDAKAISDTNPHDSDVIELFEFDGCGLQLITTGNLQGAWTVLQSMDYSSGDRDILPNAGTWDDITSLLNAAPTAVTTASNQYRQLTGFFGGAVKVRFTATSGNGTVTAIALGKSNGS